MTTAKDQAIAERLNLAISCAHRAGNLTLGYFESGDFNVDRKQDNSPVTIADKKAEHLIREEIEKHFPKDGILGEEEGTKEGSNDCRWIVDPLDGTDCFVRGVGQFGTLIAIEIAGEINVGACYMPVLSELIFASSNQTTKWLRDRRLREESEINANAGMNARVSENDDLKNAYYCVTSLSQFNEYPGLLEKLRENLGRGRGWGDCLGHTMVATGRSDIMFDPVISLWDVAPFQIILEQAGGHLLSMKGVRDPGAGNNFSVNDKLKSEILEFIL